MKRDRMETEGVVTNVCRGIFQVDISTNENSVIVSCTLSGRIKTQNRRVLLGDKVKVELSEYEPTKGRITRRLRT